MRKLNIILIISSIYLFSGCERPCTKNNERIRESFKRILLYVDSVPRTCPYPEKNYLDLKIEIEHAKTLLKEGCRGHYDIGIDIEYLLRTLDVKMKEHIFACSQLKYKTQKNEN